MEVGAEQGGEGPFVVGCAVEGLVECGRDEGFEDEEAAEVDTEVRVKVRVKGEINQSFKKRYFEMGMGRTRLHDRHPNATIG